MPLRKGRRPQIKEVKILKHKKIMILALTLLLLTALCCTSALAAGGDVAGAVEQTWTEAAKQIKGCGGEGGVPGAGYDPRHRVLCKAWRRVF